MSGGTLEFPNLGRHCMQPDCYQLDFLPFTCNRCSQVFCLEHRTHKSHDCPIPDKSDRKIFVCDVCTTSIETTGRFGEDEKAIIEKHQKSRDCDPAKKKKPRCPMNRCKEILTFSNNVVCKSCNIKHCLKHRFPADHACKRGHSSAAASANSGISDTIVQAFSSRNGKDCVTNGRGPVTSSSSRSVKAF